MDLPCYCVAEGDVGEEDWDEFGEEGGEGDVEVEKGFLFGGWRVAGCGAFRLY